MNYLKSIDKDGLDVESAGKVLTESLAERDFNCRESRRKLEGMGVDPAEALVLLARHKSGVKYGYEISPETPRRLLGLAGNGRNEKNGAPLRRLSESPFFLVKACWLYEHAPAFFMFEKNSEACENLVFEYAKRYEAVLNGQKGPKSGRNLRTIGKTFLKGKQKRVMMTTFWESKIMDPLLLVEKTKDMNLEGLEICVDFHPFNFTKLLPEEFTFGMREAIWRECRRSRIKLDIHSPIVGPYTPVPSPAGGKQRFYNPADCLDVQYEVIDLARDIGAGCIVFHLIDISDPKKMISLVEKAGGSRVRITFENYCQTDICQTSAMYLECMAQIYNALPKELRQRNFGVTMDVGHLNIEGEDPLVGAERIGKWCKDKNVFLRVHATDNYGKLLFSPPAYSADVHSNVSGKGIDNALIIKLLRGMGLEFEVVAEQIKPLTPADIATIHNAQAFTLDRTYEDYCRKGKATLSKIERGAFINPAVIREPAYNFLVGLQDITALREYLVYRQIQDKKHLSVDEAKKVSQDFRSVSKQHKIDLTSYMDDLLLPIQTETGSVQKSELDLICQNISSVLYETIGMEHLDRVFSSDRTYKNGEAVYEQHSQGREMFLVKEGQAEVFIDGSSVATLESGKVFGEIGLFYNISRSATIRAASGRTRIGSLNRRGLENLFIHGHPVVYELIRRLFNILPGRLRNLNEKYKSAINALHIIYDGDEKRVPNLGHVQMENRLDIGEFLPVLEQQEIRKFEKGDLIFAEGEKGDGAYFILDGKVKVVASSDNYTEILLGKLDRGRIFGEMALIDDKPRSASIVTLAPCKTAFIHRKAFDDIIEKKSELAFRLMGFICLSLYRSILRLDKFYSEVKSSKTKPKKDGKFFLDGPGKLGQYLTIAPETIVRGLNLQQQYALKGIRKLFGQVLLEMQAVTRDRLIEAIHLQRFERLKVSSLFSDLSENELKNLSDLVYEKNVDAGETFIFQDEIGESFFVIIKGEARVYRTGEFAEEISLAVFGPGECVGEMGYFSDRKRSASVRAVRDTQLIEINYDDLPRAFDIAPKLAVNFMNIVTKRLSSLNVRLQDTFHRSRRAEHSLENLRSLLDLSDVLALRTGIEGLIQRVVHLAGKVMKADRASLFLIDEAAGELWSKVAMGDGMDEIRMPMDRGVAGWIARNGELVNIPDAYKDPRFDGEVDMLSGYHTQSILGGPVKDLRGNIIGVVQVINKKEGAFGREDENLFRAFASQTAIAVENYHLYNQIITNHEKMTVFLDVATSISQTLDLDTLINQIVTKVSEILNAERSTLFLLNRETGELWSKVAQGAGTTVIRFPASKGLAGHTASGKKILNIKNAYEDPRFDPTHDRETGYKTQSVLSAPVINRSGEVVGVTQTINKKSGGFDSEDEELLRALSSQLAVALENAQLYEQTLYMKNYLESIHESISNCIVTLDESYRIVTVNRAASAFFSQAAGITSVLGRDMRAILGGVNKYIGTRIRRAFESNQPVSVDDFEVRMQDGNMHSLNINILPLWNLKGEIQGVVVVFEDISREKRIKGALTRYMSRDIVEKMLEDPEKQALGGVRGRASILFSDIRGFTGLAENLSAERTVEFLNRYFSVMADIVFKNGGILDKYIGDAIMAVFGVPYAKKDDGARAVQTALDMVAALDGFNARMKGYGYPPIEIGVGICSGDVISGNIGSQKRMDYTVIGDGVNISSRLESLNKQYGTKILIGETTEEEIHGRFATRVIDYAIIKGKKTPTHIYEVLGEKDHQMTDAQLNFSKGYDLYRKEEFGKAAAFFEKGADQDPPCRVFLERCLDFGNKKRIPEKDGIWISEEK